MLNVSADVGTLGELLAQRPIDVLGCSALPRTSRVAEIDRHAHVDPQLCVLCQLCPGFGAVTGQCRPIFCSGAKSMTGHERQVQQHRKTSGALRKALRARWHQHRAIRQHRDPTTFG